jgi:hypothetical protein
MLLQALLSIAFITVLAGALLTSALIDVKVASHETETRLTSAALARGTNEFVNWAQRYVSKYGASAAWPTSTITDEPEPACLATPTTSSACSSFITIAYAVVGTSAAPNGGPDLAQNLQAALNENRISATVTATITDQNGDVESSRTRLVTVRVLEAPPFAIVTGERDAATIANNIGSEEGDTGGYMSSTVVNFQATPDPSAPSYVKDTTLRVTMSCSNSKENDSDSSPFANNHSPGNDFKPWGTSGGSGFETPCAPQYAFSEKPPIPADAKIGQANVYDVGNFQAASWLARGAKQLEWPQGLMIRP